jgi:hypothetical protein
MLQNMVRFHPVHVVFHANTPMLTSQAIFGAFTKHGEAQFVKNFDFLHFLLARGPWLGTYTN